LPKKEKGKKHLEWPESRDGEVEAPATDVSLSSSVCRRARGGSRSPRSSAASLIKLIDDAGARTPLGV
jgi:hypothetical protein